MLRISMAAVVLSFSTLALAEDKPADPRAVVEQYIAAALAGKTDDAVKLAVEGQSPGKKERIEEFKALVNAKAVKLTTVSVGEGKGQAIAVSEEIKIENAKPDRQDHNLLLFLVVKSGDKWLVKDIDFANKEKVKDQFEKFKERNKDAKELPAK